MFGLRTSVCFPFLQRMARILRTHNTIRLGLGRSTLLPIHWTMDVTGFWFLLHLLLTIQRSAGMWKEVKFSSVWCKIYAPSVFQLHQVEIWWAHINYNAVSQGHTQWTAPTAAAAATELSVWAWIYLLHVHSILLLLFHPPPFIVFEMEFTYE